MRRAVLPVAFAVCAWLAACGDGAGPDVTRVDLGATGGDPEILHQSANAPPLETYQKSIEACYGESAELRIDYQSAGGAEPDEFLELRISRFGLWKNPRKNPKSEYFLPGDCVTISVSVDPEYLLAEFHPAGLEFNPAAPATLTLSYAGADPDYNGDGTVDENDQRIETSELDVWRLPHDAAEGWEQLYAFRYVGEQRLEARLASFSHYAVAH